MKAGTASEVSEREPHEIASVEVDETRGRCWLLDVNPTMRIPWRYRLLIVYWMLLTPWTFLINGEFRWPPKGIALRHLREK